MDDICEEIFLKMKETGFYMFNRNQSYQDTLRYLRHENYINNPGGVDNLRFIPVELGLKVIESGGWYAYKEQNKLKEFSTSEKIKNDLTISRIQSKYWYFPYILSGLSLIASVVAISIAYKSYKLAEEKQKSETVKVSTNDSEKKP